MVSYFLEFGSSSGKYLSSEKQTNKQNKTKQTNKNKKNKSPCISHNDLNKDLLQLSFGILTN